MKYALNLSEDGRILSATFEEYATKDMPLVDSLPEGDISEYLYQNGEYIHDPIPVPEKGEEPVSLETRVEALETDNTEMKEALEMILSGVTE